MNNPTISLESNIQHNRFIRDMSILRDNLRDLSKYDSDLHGKLTDAYEMFGREMSLTRKQASHIEQVAFELEKGKYRG